MLGFNQANFGAEDSGSPLECNVMIKKSRRYFTACFLAVTLLIPVWAVEGVPFGTQTAERWDTYAAWMIENGLIPDDLDVAAAWNSSFLSASATPVATS